MKKRIKEYLKKIFCLPPLPTVLIAVPSFILVFTVLAKNMGGVISYVAYLLSAYALVITITGFPHVVHSVRQYILSRPLMQRILEIPLVKRLLGDVFFRTEFSLYRGLLINLLYAGIKMYSGISYHSFWFGALSVYYILLAIMRFALLRSVHKHPIGQDLTYELRWYRFCGVALLFMNQALAVIVILVVHQNSGFDYPGYLIYVMALYAFYAVISAGIGLVKHRKQGSPVMSATKVIQMTAALVSMLSLETAMLSRFGGEGNTDFRRIMTAISGGVVCVFVLGMAVFMIIRSVQRTKKLRINNPQT